MANFILPKGFVHNSPEIEGDIAKSAAEPLTLADIGKMWKVYTTTQRKLHDPTAERLESFWWRIWGSRGRDLNGATIARLFASISTGESFVPLRGPPNRYEGTPPLNVQARQGAMSSTTASQHSSKSRPSTTSTPKFIAPMPHPILKKTRGPSTSGPRPTARFISPHDTEDDTDPASSSLSTNSHVLVQPPSPDSASIEGKASTTTGRKKGVFAASTKKKRPVIIRRQNSQSSSENREANAANSSTIVQSSSERTPPTFPEQARRKTSSKFQEEFSPASDGATTKTKSPKKKTSSRAAESRRNASENVAPLQRTHVSHPRETSGDPGPSTTIPRQENVLKEVDGLNIADLDDPEVQEELELQRTLLEEANTRANRRQTPAKAPISSRASSGMNPPGSLGPTSDKGYENQGMGATHILPHGAKSTVGLALNLADVAGQLNLSGDAIGEETDADKSSRVEKGKGRDPEELASADMFAKKPVGAVVASSPAVNGPLSRSKSQLTLLLEKDRVRTSDKKSERRSGKEKSPGRRRKDSA